MQKNQAGRRDVSCSLSLCPTLWRVYFQAQGICAGIRVSLWFRVAFMRSWLPHPMIVAILPVFLWVLRCGTTYYEYVHLGNCVTYAFSLGGPATLLFPCYLEKGDVQHPHGCSDCCMFFEATWSLMMLYSHQPVKERASPSCPWSCEFRILRVKALICVIVMFLIGQLAATLGARLNSAGSVLDSCNGKLLGLTKLWAFREKGHIGL